jgi:hypothetical protein
MYVPDLVSLHRKPMHAFKQGLEGPVIFSGSTPELDDFTIRIEDGEHEHTYPILAY